jgi:hypothetical protein
MIVERRKAYKQHIAKHLYICNGLWKSMKEYITESEFEALKDLLLHNLFKIEGKTMLNPLVIQKLKWELEAVSTTQQLREFVNLASVETGFDLDEGFEEVFR